MITVSQEEKANATWLSLHVESNIRSTVMCTFTSISAPGKGRARGQGPTPGGVHPYRSVAQSCPTLMQTGHLKQQTLILSQSWRLEVQGQFVGRTVISLKALEESVPCLSLTLCCHQPSLTRRRFTPTSGSVITWSPPSGSVTPCLPFL